ncbi:MAG: HEPN domain-containing protein [Cyanobacteriota bacterium]|nr:HEPN domain-containing protein [Cyanobacteriota bacterium]
MSPAEDALLLLGIVRRHLRALEQTLQSNYPDEDWGFTAQQVMDKILKAWIVLADRRPPHTHELAELMPLANVAIPEVILQLQVFAVEARYEEGPFPLPGPRAELLGLLHAELQRLEGAIAAAKS